MAEIIMRRRLTTPTRAAIEVDWSNPRTRGIVELMVPCAGRSLVGKVMPTASAIPTAQRVVGGPVGYGLQMIETGAKMEFVNPKARIAAPLSILLFHSMPAVPSTALRTFGNLHTFAYGFGFAPNASNFRAIVSNGSNTILTGDAVVAGTHIEVLTIDSGGNARLYRNGRLTAGPSSAPMTTPTGNLSFGLESGGGAGGVLNDIYYLGVLWNRALPALEVMELSRSIKAPFQLVQPVRRLLPLDATVSGAAFRARPYYDLTTHHGISGAGV